MSDISTFPVIISRRAAFIEAAREEAIAVILTDRNACRLQHGETGDVIGPGEPSTTFSLSGHANAPRKDWLVLADWLDQTLARLASAESRALILMDHDHPWREFLLYLSRVHGLSFGLLHAEPMPAIRAMEYALLSNAAVHVFETPELADLFRKANIMPFREFFALGDIKELHLPAQDNAWIAAKPANMTGGSAKGRPDAKTRPLRVLLMAYFSGACRAVGVARVNYWFEELNRLSEGQIDVELATATDWLEDTPGVHRIRDHNIASVLDDNGDMPGWGRAFAASEQANARSFSTLSHYWRVAAERHFDRLDTHFDVVLISGNPFSCFDFAAYAKRRWHARVILDYRDPFANNPRILYADDQRAHARYIERGYNFQADLLTTVNQDCYDFLCKDAEQKAVIIENGYDDRLIKKIIPTEFSSSKIHFVHAGSFYHYGRPDALVAELVDEKHRFHHIGNVDGLNSDFAIAERASLYGRRSYAETLKIIAGCDVGVVFVSESGFETTTKIFDYLAFDLDVLIITQGRPQSGALATVLDGVPRVFWCRNDRQSIASFLSNYKPDHTKKRNATQRFSRGFQTLELIRCLRPLVP